MIEEKSILEVKNLSKSFGGVQALKDVNINIQKNKIHGLIGPNGAGKSTFFNVVSGLYPPTEGKVWFNSIETSYLAPDKISRLGISRTFQDARLVPNMTVLDNVMTGQCFTGYNSFLNLFFKPFYFSSQERKIKKQAIEVLKFIGIPDYADFWTSELVWVERQMVQVARALISDPQLLLLDEPSAGMGIEETKVLSNVIREINKKGVTIIVVSHDIKFISEISDWITVLDFGEKISEGNPEQIRNDPIVIEAYLGE